MSKTKKDTIEAKGFAIQIYTKDFKNDYISLTDISRYKSDEPSDVIKNWMRRKDTIEFLGLWGSLNNMNFNSVEFDRIKSEAGYNTFTLSPKKWVEKTEAIGIISKGGRYGGTFAHTDIAFEFASWISAEFKMYVIQDYKRLKSDENSKLSLGWNLNREISKINYKIHTDSISEADMLNVALFNKRSKQWREENPNLKGNMRDYASLNELLVLARTQLMSIEKLNNTGIKSLENKS
ncbi:KilA-N domain-containing protein [Sneathia sp. DSM 16631]|uniref:KilA-N domain-containing protein n=1 Tax=Sneathia TaxID=168808 RepID=UPI00186715B0|nr:KilA-N domain-containing protein [Sneathia sp. DSM 16631]